MINITRCFQIIFDTIHFLTLIKLVPDVGFELTTYRLQGDCNYHCANPAIYLVHPAGIEPTTLCL